MTIANQSIWVVIKHIFEDYYAGGIEICGAFQSNDIEETCNNVVWVVACDKAPGYTVSISIDFPEIAVKMIANIHSERRNKNND